MPKSTASRTVTTFSDLPELYAAYPDTDADETADTAEDDQEEPPIDAEVAYMQEGRGSLISRGDLAELQARVGLTDPFAASFGDPLPLSIVEFGEEPGEHDMPDPFAAQAECGALVATIFDLFGDTRLERHAGDVAWGIVNTFHFVASKVEREENRVAAEILDMTRRLEPGEVFNKELEDKQLLCQSMAEHRACLSAMCQYAAAMYRACSGRAWIPSKGSRAVVPTASQISAMDFLRARAEKRRDSHDPQGPIVFVSGPAIWHDWQLIWNRLDLIKLRIENMVVVTTGQDKGVDAVAHAWAEANGRPWVPFDLKGFGKGKGKGFRRNKSVNELPIVEAILVDGSGIQHDLYDLFNPPRGRRVPTHLFYESDQCPMPPIQKPRRKRAPYYQPAPYFDSAQWGGAPY